MYALVDATPISQPALMWTPQCVIRAMALPTVLVTPTHSAPRALMYSKACMHTATCDVYPLSRYLTPRRQHTWQGQLLAERVYMA